MMVTLMWSNSQTIHSRSEEHTSELQSQSNLVCRLLLEKKKHSRRHLPYRMVSTPTDHVRVDSPACHPRHRRRRASVHASDTRVRLEIAGQSLLSCHITN